MDFFAQQDRARRNTTLLVVLFCVAMVSLIALTNVAVLITIMQMKAESQETDFVFDWQLFLDPQVVALVSLGVITVVLAAILYKWFSLAEGGKCVAESLGGERIYPNTTNTAQLQVLNVVEEMALASGMPVPPVYLLKHEVGINAFAAGHTPADAVIGVTTGCMNALDRDQLQGVIAHEFSHILNGDMRLNLRLMAVLHGIVFIGHVGEVLLRSQPRHGSKDSRNMGVLGIALFLIGWLGNFFGQIIRSIVSRQREFLADASAVQFTRNPDGIAGALKVIGGYEVGTQVYHKKSAQLGHMFFGQALTSSLSRLFNTHPPLMDRILAIDPKWNGEYLTPAVRAQDTSELSDKRQEKAEKRARKEDVMSGAVMGWAVNEAPVGLSASIISGDVAGAQEMIAHIPAELLQRAREPMGAMALVFGVVQQLQAATVQDVSIKSKYLADIEPVLKDFAGVFDELKGVSHSLDDLPRPLYLPLLELCFPALKCLSLVQYKVFKQQLLNAIRLDKKVDLYEWCLFQLLTHYLDPEFGLEKLSKPKFKDAAQVSEAACLVLSLLAYEGHNDDEQTQRAFTRGAGTLGLYTVSLKPLNECKLIDFSKAVNELASSQPYLKARLIRGFVNCIKHDEQITILEYEMLRSIAAVMDSPIPQLDLN